MPSSTITAPPRPPRPQHISEDVLREAASRVGMRTREIVGVYDTAGGGRVIETHDGTAMIDVPADRPDGAGRTGLLIYRGNPGLKSTIPWYTGPKSLPQEGAHEAWTVEDLDLAASRQVVPTAEGGPGGPSHKNWVGLDPVRARAVWTQIALGRGWDYDEAARMDAEAHHCRQVILAAGWLSARAAKSL